MRSKNPLTTADTEEHPRIDSQAKTKGKSNVCQGASVRVIRNANVLARLGSSTSSVGNLRGRKGAEEEQESADKLADDGHKVISKLVGKISQKGQAKLVQRAIGRVSASTLHTGKVQPSGSRFVDLHRGVGRGDTC